MAAWLVRIAIALVIAVGSVSLAAADGIKAWDFGDFAFMLPDIGKRWEQEKKAGLLLVRDESDGLSDLEIAVFAPAKPGSLAEIEARLGTELARSHVAFFGEKVTVFKVVKSSDEIIATSPFRVGIATLNGQKAAFAIGQRGGKTIILVGVGNEGVEERALTNFNAIVHKLARPMVTPAETGAGEPQGHSDDMPRLGEFVAVKDITASSTFIDRSKQDLYGAWRVLTYSSDVDGSPRTAWCEGKADEGIGEGISIRFASPTKLDRLRIAAGVWRSPKLYAANNRITSLALRFDGGPAMKVTPPLDRRWLEVKVGKSVSSVRLTIDKVTKGKMNDSCISAVDLVAGDQTLAVLTGMDPAAVAALPAGYAALWTALSDKRRTGLDKLVSYPLTYASSDWFFERNHQAVKYATQKSITLACQKQQPGCPSGPNTGGRDDAASVEGKKNRVRITFPSRREVVDVWDLVWHQSAWKVRSIGYIGVDGE